MRRAGTQGNGWARGPTNSFATRMNSLGTESRRATLELTARLADLEGIRVTRLFTHVAIAPNHIFPIVNLADSVSVVAAGMLAERWLVAASAVQ